MLHSCIDRQQTQCNPQLQSEDKTSIGKHLYPRTVTTYNRRSSVHHLNAICRVPVPDHGWAGAFQKRTDCLLPTPPPKRSKVTYVNMSACGA